VTGKSLGLFWEERGGKENQNIFVISEKTGKASNNCKGTKSELISTDI